MSYFNNFPTVAYNFEINGQTTLIAIKDIALNVRVRKEILENITLFDEYDIEDNETFDIISEKLYGKPIYQWVIMLLNQRFDYRTDFPLTAVQLIRYCEQKYGKDHVYDQHIIFGNLHYEDRDGNIVQKLTEDQFIALYPYSSYAEYQQSLIDLVSPNYPVLLTEEQFDVLDPLPFATYQEYLYNRQQIIDEMNETILKTGMSELHFNQQYPYASYEEYSRGFEQISNFEYEDKLNESKRRIKVLNPSMIDKVVSDIQRLLAGA